MCYASHRRCSIYPWLRQSKRSDLVVLYQPTVCLEGQTVRKMSIFSYIWMTIRLLATVRILNLSGRVPKIFNIWKYTLGVVITYWVSELNTGRAIICMTTCVDEEDKSSFRIGYVKGSRSAVVIVTPTVQENDWTNWGSNSTDEEYSVSFCTGIYNLPLYSHPIRYSHCSFNARTIPRIAVDNTMKNHEKRRTVHISYCGLRFSSYKRTEF